MELKPSDQTLPNGLTVAQLERLTKLVEEAAEVQQIVGKILLHGFESRSPKYPDGDTNRELLEFEISHFLVAMGMLHAAKDLSLDSIEKHYDTKKKTIRKYLRYQDDVLDILIQEEQKEKSK